MFNQDGDAVWLDNAAPPNAAIEIQVLLDCRGVTKGTVTTARTTAESNEKNPNEHHTHGI